jgi:hypothetical protein
MEIIRKAARFLFGLASLPLFLVLMIPVAIVAALWGAIVGNKRELKPTELAEILRRIADDSIGDEWDEFECVALEDERLEAIRLRAFPFCGRPGPVDSEALRRLAEEAAALS